jgi:hypothetical protein
LIFTSVAAVGTGVYFAFKHFQPSKKYKGKNTAP